MKEQLEKFSNELKEELLNILNYWQKHTIDHENGGFYGQIDNQNNIIANASRGAVLNTRILWTFSAAYNFTKNKSYLNTATWAFDYIRAHFIDQLNGGLVWEVDHHGKPLSSRKQTYAQGFGIYGFSEYYKASKDQESLNISKSLYEVIESHCFDQDFGGYLEALSKDWEPMEDMRLSAKDENYPKSMNTHLHILEPYTNLYRVWPDPGLAKQMKKLIRTFLDHIIDPETGHFNLFFERDWTVKSEIISYGHDIEGAWLLTEAVEVLGDKALIDEVESVAIKMTDVTMDEGAASDGSLYYERESATGYLDTDRHWWPQAEAIVGFLNAYQITGSEQYLKQSIRAWEFIKSNLVDKQNGEWFWSVNGQGLPDVNNDKAGFWKCPYHNSRACMEAVNRINFLLKSGS